MDRGEVNVDPFELSPSLRGSLATNLLTSDSEMVPLIRPWEEPFKPLASVGFLHPVNKSVAAAKPINDRGNACCCYCLAAGDLNELDDGTFPGSRKESIIFSVVVQLDWMSAIALPCTARGDEVNVI